MRSCVAPWLALALLSAGATAAPADDAGAEWRSLAERAVRQRYEQPGTRVVASVEALDTHLHLAPCPAAAQAQLPTRTQPTSRLSVQLHCPVPGGWTARVVVRLEIYRQVLVTTRPLLRGDGLAVTDVRAEERDIARLGYGYLDNVAEASGRSLARPLPAGSVLTPATFTGRQLVRPGDSVQMLARLDGIEVRADGVALGGGDTGARLRVRNGSSGKVVDAVVVTAGQVEALP
ncbi:flagellar basal body P-ring formation chaperone FlgA [Dyella subtropica]|uniref:flagellar basal body P-ring formation chaperone FlgA n=1 Tax=Dyella subtropica TaxID=2992127 RepID=UPI00225BD272|nr:flagellar basal body P-ring formation chaperone FlgA [Dyella subtropica]